MHLPTVSAEDCGGSDLRDVNGRRLPSLHRIPKEEGARRAVEEEPHHVTLLPVERPQRDIRLSIGCFEENLLRPLISVTQAINDLRVIGTHEILHSLASRRQHVGLLRDDFERRAKTFKRISHVARFPSCS